MLNVVHGVEAITFAKRQAWRARNPHALPRLTGMILAADVVTGSAMRVRGHEVDTGPVTQLQRTSTVTVTVAIPIAISVTHG